MHKTISFGVALALVACSAPKEHEPSLHDELVQDAEHAAGAEHAEHLAALHEAEQAEYHDAMQLDDDGLLGHDVDEFGDFDDMEIIQDHDELIEEVAVVAMLPEVRFYQIAPTWPFCAKVITAVRGIEPEYAGRVNFVIVPAEKTKADYETLIEYGFADARHGLVGFDSQGELIGALPGHQFGEAEIREVVAAALE